MERTAAARFIAYPTNRVAGTITDAEEAKKAVQTLVAAGFEREAVDVLHGEQDLRRLDPSGGEHGIFAQLQRSLIRGAVGPEFKHLTHHVEDLQAGRFVVMVLAAERRLRDVAAEILHAHGAEFVGFYGRWAYESLPQEPAAATAAIRTYDIAAGQETTRIRIADGVATVMRDPSLPAIATPVGAHLWLISWRQNATAIVHMIDVDRGISYTSLTPSNSVPMHVKGTVTLVDG